MEYRDSIEQINHFKEIMDYKNDSPKGLSVIIPVYDGMQYIDRCLKSLSTQRIDDAEYEIILVLNGKFLKELEFIYNESSYYSEMDITVLINEKAGAGAARNMGIDYAKYSHITFIDVDDYISNEFVQANFNSMTHDTITLSQIYDLEEDNVVIDNTINDEILKNSTNSRISYRDVMKILTITVCKAIPKPYLIHNRFKEHLRSGEDTVLFTEIIVNHRPKINVVPLENDAIYYRQIREDSVSRKDDTYDFLIDQRIDILRILDPMLEKINDKDIYQIVNNKYRAQISFMNRFLRQYPNEHPKVVDLLRKYNFAHFDYRLLNRYRASTLVFSYCFAPFSDTSATIVVKRILEKREIVDVFSNNMLPIRNKDESLKEVVEPYLSNLRISQSKPTFKNFHNLSEYVDESFLFYCANKKYYEEIYSRAMFPISHIPPLFVKLNNPGVYWKAEFSDPLLFDIESEMRNSKIDIEHFIDHLKSGILEEFTSYVDDNLFNLAEIIPFALADEIVFTNENQMEYMIKRFDEDLQKKIKSKSTISQHPILNHEYYHLKESNYNFNYAYINVGYFGNFYSRRDVDEIVFIKNRIENETNYKIKFHVFTNIKNLSEKQSETLINNEIIVNDYVPYFEFLNLSTQLDVLLVLDSETKTNKEVNPYLPSKVSDYLGSGSVTLALTEEGSILSQMDKDNLYKLDVNDIINDSFDMNNFIKSIVNNKDEYLKEDACKMEVGNKFYNITINNSLELRSGHDEWQFRPKESPISFNKQYKWYLKNNYNEPLTLQVKSFYIKNGIVDIIVRLNNEETMICITEFNDTKEYKIYPQEEISFEVKYNKEYKKPSFLKAGRLNLSIKGLNFL